MASDTLLPLRQGQGKENPRTSDDDVGNGSSASASEEDVFQNRPRRKAINRLEPALHILERFHHRNKNQHRINKWWAEADMLRRQVRKILGGLHAGLGDEEREVTRLQMLARKGSSSVVKKGKGNEKEQEKENEDEHGFKKDEFGIYERAVYIRGLLVPRAWFAFTQLVADRQFSQLGLMLLAVLAQVDQALSSFAPGPELDGEAGLQDEREMLSVAAAGAVNLGAVEEEILGEDVGVAISRDDYLLSTITSPSIERKNAEETRAAAERLERLDRRTQRRMMMDDDLNTDMDVDMDTDDNGRPSSPTMAVSTESEKKAINVTALEAEEVAGEEDEKDSAIGTKRKKKRPRVDKEQDSNGEDREWGGISDGEDPNDDIGNIFASLIPKKKKKVKEVSASTKTVAKLKKRKEEEEEEKEPQDDIVSIFDSLIPKKTTKKSSSTTTATASVKSKSKEESKGSGTEKKKKKKKQGDEFDDIFGGLL